MENMEEEPPTPPPPTSPFWIQPATRSRHRLLFRPPLPSPSFFLSSGFLIVILCILAIVFLVLVIPSLLSLTHQVFKPSSVRKGWDSLNLVLVLFAVVCGFLGGKGHQEQKDQDDLDHSFNVSRPQSPLRPHHQFSNWYEYEYCENQLGNVSKLRRTSTSYPDLRKEISWDVEYDHRPRYYDDSYAINETRPLGSFRSRRGFDGDEVEADISDLKEIEMDTVTGSKSRSIPLEKEVALSSPPLLTPPPPPTPMYYSTRVRKPPRKEYETITRRVRKVKEPPPPPPSPPIVKARPPPPPPAPPPSQPPNEHHQFDNIRKKGGKSVTKDILTSIYNTSKRKNKLLKRKSHENLKDLRPPSPPPPPPPPPPPHELHNNFSSKKPKSGKKIASSFINITRPTTTKATEFNDHETTDSGYESPTIPIPPPPPPPPFKLPPWKFVVHGDYVKITSSPKRGGDHGSDESEFEDIYSATNIPVAGNVKQPVFCRSPDVNTKADDFIARFKATLKLEKINLGTGLSPLGPDSSPSPSPHAMEVSGSF